MITYKGGVDEYNSAKNRLESMGVKCKNYGYSAVKCKYEYIVYNPVLNSCYIIETNVRHEAKSWGLDAFIMEVEIFLKSAQVINYSEKSNSAEYNIHPSHYQSDPLAPINVIREWDLNFNKGNAVKYIVRAGKKGSAVEDILKAIEYLKHEVEFLRENEVHS